MKALFFVTPLSVFFVSVKDTREYLGKSTTTRHPIMLTLTPCIFYVH